MTLFNINNITSFPFTNIDGLTTTTPLGQFQFNCSFNERSVCNQKPQSILINPSTMFSSWMFDECQIEFLRFDFKPRLPAGMKVDKCMAGIWRIKAFKDNIVFKFKSTLNTSLKASPESGEGLLSQSFESNSVKLNIGTEDEEFMMRRAKSKNWLPLHFEILPENIIYTDQGLEIDLPACKESDYIQIHFIMTWASKANGDVSTWFAADQSAESLLKSQKYLST